MDTPAPLSLTFATHALSLIVNNVKSTLVFVPAVTLAFSLLLISLVYHSAEAMDISHLITSSLPMKMAQSTVFVVPLAVHLALALIPQIVWSCFLLLMKHSLLSHY